eukprot:gene3907-4270_t
MSSLFFSFFALFFDWQILTLILALSAWIFTSQDDENLLIKLALRKFAMYLDSIIFMALSKDNKGVGHKKNPDPDDLLTKTCTTKTIIFIRHGESDWNHVFNKGINPGLILRLLLAMKEELLYYASPHSIFLDSPLNLEGIDQAVELRKFLEDSTSLKGASDEVVNHIRTLRGEGRSSIVVSSTLRRAVATTTVALWPRVERRHEKIHILSSLQEISRNVDTYSLSAAEKLADLPFNRITPHCGGTENFRPDQVYDTSNNFGNKSFSFYGIKRLLAFNEWAFKREEETIIVGGHSLWFKHFFQTFLPHSCHHEAKSKKMTNSGVVAFSLQQTFDTEDGLPRYRIVPESVTVVYGGFTTK